MNAKLLFPVLLSLLLSACADMSMYHQVPAPVGQAGQNVYTPAQQPSTTADVFALEPPEKIEPFAYETDRLTSQNPAVIALLEGAQEKSAGGEYGLAVLTLERAVRISPSDPKIWHALAKARFSQSQYEMSISLAKKSNMLAKNNSLLQRGNWRLIAENYTRLGQPDAATRAMDSAEKLF
mgnify:FL=1